MMVSVQNKYPMTEAGLQQLIEELSYLETVKRPEIDQRIKHARSFCDFAEDSEYDAALAELASLKKRIATIEHMIQEATIIQDTGEASDTVRLGSAVTFMELPDGDEETFTIVGVAEADALTGKISNHSPMAKSLLGHRVGDRVVVGTPSGSIHVKITAIE